MNKPIKKQPITLAMKVANGNWLDQNLETKTVVRKRRTLPVAPPIAMYRIVFSIFNLGLSPSTVLRLRSV